MKYAVHIMGNGLPILTYTLNQEPTGVEMDLLLKLHLQDYPNATVAKSPILNPPINWRKPLSGHPTDKKV